MRIGSIVVRTICNDSQSKMEVTTITITPTRLAVGIASMNAEAASTKINTVIPATMPEIR